MRRATSYPAEVCIIGASQTTRVREPNRKCCTTSCCYRTTRPLTSGPASLSPPDSLQPPTTHTHPHPRVNTALTVVQFYDEDDTFERIGLELILSPFETSYANEGPAGTSGMSFILKHKSVNAYVAPKHGGVYVRLARPHLLTRAHLTRCLISRSPSKCLLTLQRPPPHPLCLITRPHARPPAAPTPASSRSTTTRSWSSSTWARPTPSRPPTTRPSVS